ncbi:MAG: hypothetical protein Q8L77_02920 [Nitrospirota bacterium]|nr:hypothetical protein [Nitrospirota bacterium]
MVIFTRIFRHGEKIFLSGYQGSYPRILLEFPWNVYGFRDILPPNMLRGNGDVSCVPVDEVEAVGSVNMMLFEDRSFTVARLPAIVLNLLGMSKDAQWT